MSTLSADRLARRLAGGAAAPHALGLDFAGCRIRVRTDSAQLAGRLARYYADFAADPDGAEVEVTALEAPAPEPAAVAGLELAAKPPEPGKSRVKEEFVELEGGRAVRKRLTGMVFVFGPELNLAVGPCLANDNQVVNFINSRHIQWLLDRGWLLGHAAGVSDRAGRGLALAGFSGKGKSTLGLHLMERGLWFVSNDRLLVRRGPRGLEMAGVAKLPRINPGTALNNPALAQVMPPAEAARCRGLAPGELWALEQKYDVYLDQCFGPGRFRLGAGLEGLVVLTWSREAGPPVMSLAAEPRRAELLEAFIKPPGLFYLPPAGGGPDLSRGAYLAELAACPIYEIGGGVDFAAATRAAAAILGRAGGEA
jgi:HprK-related kinase B